MPPVLYSLSMALELAHQHQASPGRWSDLKNVSPAFSWDSKRSICHEVCVSLFYGSSDAEMHIIVPSWELLHGQGDTALTMSIQTCSWEILPSTTQKFL